MLSESQLFGNRVRSRRKKRTTDKDAVLKYLTELFFLVGILIFIYFRKEIKLDRKIIQFFGILFTIVFITYNFIKLNTKVPGAH